jgi:microcystin-dependent protein
MYVILFLFILVFLCSLSLFYFKDTNDSIEGFTFAANMEDILPITITPDNKTISVPNTVRGNDGSNITFGGDLIVNQNSRIKGTQIVDKELTVYDGMSVSKGINTDFLNSTGIVNIGDGEIKKNGHNALAPVGSIMAFVGMTDPNGWVICDGVGRPDDGRFNRLHLLGVGSKSNGQYFPPNLKDKFLKGTNNANLQEMNTDPKVTLIENNIPSHSHTGTTGLMNSNASHQHNTLDNVKRSEYDWQEHEIDQAVVTLSNNNSTASGLNNSGGRISQYPWRKLKDLRTTYTDTNHTHTFTTEKTGSGVAFNIPPPLYYTINYIVKY